MAVQLTVAYVGKEETVTAERPAVMCEILNADIYQMKIRGSLYELDRETATETILDGLSGLRRVESFHTAGNKHVVTVHPWKA